MSDRLHNFHITFMQILLWSIVVTIVFFSHETSNAYIWPKYGGTLRMPISSSKLILDPSRDMSYEELAIFFAIYDCLFRIDENGNVLPNLATDFSTDNFYKEYTIHIDKRARFHDGTPVRGIDVASALNNTIQRTGIRSSELSNIIEIKPLSETDIEFILKETDPDFPRKLAHPFCAVIKGDAITKSIGPASITYYVGTGAFRIRETNRKSSIRLERNAHYHRGQSYLDAIEFVMIPKADDSFIEFLAGNLDIHRVSYERYKSLQNRVDCTIFERDGWDTLVIDFNNNPRRTELMGALDPEGLVRVTMNSAATEASGILPDDGRKHIQHAAFTKSNPIKGNITLGYYGDRMFLEPVAKSIATKWESKGARVSVIKLDNIPSPVCDAVLHVIKTLGQDSTFLWKSYRANFGFTSAISQPEDIYISPEEQEQRHAIQDGRFYPIARLKMVLAIDDRVRDLRLIANCVPDFWTINLK